MDATWGISITRNIWVSCWHEVFAIINLCRYCIAYKEFYCLWNEGLYIATRDSLASSFYALVKRSYFKICSALTVDSWESVSPAVTQWVKWCSLLPGFPTQGLRNTQSNNLLLYLSIFLELCSWPRTPCRWTQNSLKSRGFCQELVLWYVVRGDWSPMNQSLVVIWNHRRCQVPCTNWWICISKKAGRSPRSLFSWLQSSSLKELTLGSRGGQSDEIGSDIQI